MTDLRTAAQQALEQLKINRTNFRKGPSKSICKMLAGGNDEAIADLEAALEEPTPLEDVVTHGSAWSKNGKRIDPMSVYAEPEGGGNLSTPLQEPGDFDHAIGADRFKVVRGAFWWHVLIGDSPTEHGKFRSRAGAEKMAADLLREFRNGAFVQHEAALAESVQEPVAWVECDGDLVWNNREAAIGRNLYTSPPPQQTEPSQDTPPQHEYEVTANDDGTFSVGLPDGEELRIIPPQRPAEPVQEPVAWRYKYSDGFWRFSNGKRVNGCDPIESQALYTAPPQRKPLTEEEIEDLYFDKFSMGELKAFARAIERAHGIKE